MGRHSSPDTETDPADTESAQTRRPEPVAIAAAAQAVLAAAVAIGWIAWDDTTINTIATAVGVVGAAIITLIARSKVTPTSDPKLN